MTETGQFLVNYETSREENQNEVFFIFTLKFHTYTLRYFRKITKNNKVYICIEKINNNLSKKRVQGCILLKGRWD